MNAVVLWDLDSTLANTSHRQHMVPLIKAHTEGGPTWEDYSLACTEDYDAIKVVEEFYERTP